MAIDPGYIIAPTGQIVPGGLRDLGIGINAIPSNAPDIAAVQAAEDAALLPPPEPEPPASMTPAPPLVRVPAEIDAPQLGIPSELENFLQTGKLPRRGEPLAQRSPFDATPVPALPAPAPPTPGVATAAGKRGRAGVQPTAAAPPVGQAQPGAGPRAPNLNDVPAMLDQATATRSDAAMLEGDVAAKQAEDVYAAREVADAKAEDELLRLDAQMERDQEIFNKKTADYEAAEAAVDNFKVDRGRFWAKADTGKKLGLGIAMLLSGLGDALAGKSGPNPVIQMLQQAVKDDVDAQLDQRDQLLKRAGRRKEAADAFERFSNNRLAQGYQRLGVGNKLLEQMITTAAARSGSDAAKARGLAGAAEIRQQGVLNKGKAIEAAAQNDRQIEQNLTQRQSIAAHERTSQAQIAAENWRASQRLSSENRWHDERISLEERKRKEEFELALGKASAEQQKAMLELQKDASERGLNDPSTGRPILTPDGVKMAKEAERIEALAEEAKDPAEAQALRDKAAIMRNRAELHLLVKVSPTQAAKINNKIAGFQSAISLTEEIAGLRKRLGPKWATTTEGSQRMASLGRTLDMMLKQGFEMGALDRGSLQAAMEMRGGDPTTVTVGDISTWLGAKGTEAALDELADSLEKLGYNDLGSAGVRNAGDPAVFKFRRSKEFVKEALDERLDVLKGKTPGEFDAGMSAGARQQLQGKTPEEQRAIVDRLSQTTGGGEYRGRPIPSSVYAGLSSDQERAIDRLLETAARPTDGIDDPVERRKIRGEAAQARTAIVDLAVTSWRGKNQRPELVNGVLRALHAKAPDIYRDVLVKAPSNDLVSFAQSGDPVAREVLLARPEKDLTVAAKEYVEGAKAPPQLPSVTIGGVSADVAALPDDVLQQAADRGDQEAQRELVNRRRTRRGIQDRPPSMALE